MPHHVSTPSSATVSTRNGRSVIVDCESHAPLRFLHPFFTEQAVSLILSGYGGGLVQGDQIDINISCLENTRVFIGTQANSRVYKNDQGWPTSQSLHVTLGEGSRVVHLPDPLVLHRGSRFSQSQTWDLSSNASLLTAEWFQCGRSDSGERFAYQGYDSVIDIRHDSKLLFREPFASYPDLQPPHRTGAFGPANLMLNLIATGDAQQLLKTALQPLVDSQSGHTQVPALTNNQPTPPPGVVCSMATLEHVPVTVFRMVGVTRKDFDPVWNLLEPLLATEDWLGHDAKLPMNRQQCTPSLPV